MKSPSPPGCNRGFDLDHWLVGMSGIRNQPSPGAVNQQVQCFEDRLADDHFIADNQSLFYCASPINLYLHRLGNAYRVFAAVRVLGQSLAGDGEAQRLDDLARKHCSDRAGIDKSAGAAVADLARTDLTSARERFVYGVGQGEIRSDFTHPLSLPAFHLLHLRRPPSVPRSTDRSLRASQPTREHSLIASGTC